MDSILHRALYGIAGELQVLAFEAGIARLYESDLRSSTRRALQILVDRQVRLETKVPLKGWKEGTGKVDVVVLSQQQRSFDAAIELKFWKGAGSASETLWDAWKMASAYAEGSTWRTYLIAAGPDAIWSSADPFVSLWGAGKWSSREWWEGHLNLRKKWETKNAGPVLLPAGIRTTLIGAVPIHVSRGDPWELRCLRVTTLPGKLWPVPPLE